MSPIALCLALSLSASPADPLLERGVHVLFDARFDEAAVLFEQADDADPESPIPDFYLGYLCWLRQLPVGAEADFESCEPAVERAIAQARRAVERHPDSALAHYYLGRSYGLRVRQVASIKTFKAATADLRRCRKELGKAEELDPSLRNQSVEMGLYNYLVGKLPTLARVVRFLFRLPGGSKEEGIARLELVSRSGGLAADEALLYLSVIDLDWEKRIPQGLERLSELIERYPANPHFVSHYARTLRRRLHQQEEALPLYRRASELARPDSPADRRARLGVASCLIDLMDYDPAREQLETLIGANDSLGEKALAEKVRVGLLAGEMEAVQSAYRALSRRKTGTSERARRWAVSTLANAPDANTLQYLRSFHRARRALEQGSREAAERELGNALTVRPGDPRALAGLAAMYYEAGRYGSARPIYDGLAARHDVPVPLAALARLRLGQLAEWDGEMDQAMERYRSIEELPGVPSAKREARRRLEAARTRAALPPRPQSEAPPSPP